MRDKRSERQNHRDLYAQRVGVLQSLQMDNQVIAGYEASPVWQTLPSDALARCHDESKHAVIVRPIAAAFLGSAVGLC